MKFRDDYGVYVCPHVFNDEKPVLDAVRDPDGYWQFFCGDPSCPENTEPKLVGVGHLINRDKTIDELAKLEVASYAERKSVKSPWRIGKLDV
ncbi:MAG: hypothetical protein ABW168_02840 [Sedimenticola sp.]